jgi:hypothetical protein
MIHNLTPIQGTGKKSQAIRELQKAVRKMTPQGGANTLVNVTTRGTHIRAKGGGDGGASVQVVSRWL